MAFRDLDEFLEQGPIVLPIRGKEYSFPGEISAKSWLDLQRMHERFYRAQNGGDSSAEVLSDADYFALRSEIMGGVDTEMAADGLTSAHIKHVFLTLVAYHLNGQEAAEAVWAQGEAPAPNRATRRSKAARSTR